MFFLGLIICVVFQMTSCKNEQDNIRIGTFKGLPPEIDGCACYFSRNQKEFDKEKYICVDNYFNTAYVIINDKKVKFKSLTSSVSTDSKDTHWTKNFKSEKYHMTIEMFQIGEIDETWQQKGNITIKSDDGNQITETFYGECGC